MFQGEIISQWPLVVVRIDNTTSRRYDGLQHVFLSCPCCGDLLYDESISPEEWLTYQVPSQHLHCQLCDLDGYKVTFGECMILTATLSGIKADRMPGIAQQVIDSVLERWSGFMAPMRHQTEPNQRGNIVVTGPGPQQLSLL